MLSLNYLLNYIDTLTECVEYKPLKIYDTIQLNNIFINNILKDNNLIVYGIQHYFKKKNYSLLS